MPRPSTLPKIPHSGEALTIRELARRYHRLGRTFTQFHTTCAKHDIKAGTMKVTWSMAGRDVFGSAYVPRPRGHNHFNISDTARQYFTRAAYAYDTPGMPLLVRTVLERIAKDDLLDAILDP